MSSLATDLVAAYAEIFFIPTSRQWKDSIVHVMLSFSFRV